MSILLTNAILTDIDPPRVEVGCLRLADGHVAERGATLTRRPDDETTDCGGAVVLPGLVNGHTHLYSALATGMPPPRVAPRNFREILERIWWRLDRALEAETIELSARIGALDALRCGTTTLIDHHASPTHIAGSLDLVERGLAAAGLRGVLCYETTDRHGAEGRRAGIEENRRYLAQCARRHDHRFAAMAGAHASFTLDDESLAELTALAGQYGVGVHIHVAEDPCDEADCRERRGTSLINRLAVHGLLDARAVFAHGTHLDAEAIARVNEVGPTLAHNPRSNMNNAVGYAPVAEFRCPVMLGTDGIGGDMLAEAQHAWMISRHQHAGLTPSDIVSMLAAAARRASSALGITLGRLEPGAAADVVVTDYQPATPMTADNLPGHLLFGLSSRNVRGVITAGEWRLRGGEVIGRDERGDRSAARAAAERLWARMGALPG